MHAAREIVVREGVAGLNMREIARRARVSPATPYFYFRTKEELFLSVYSLAIAELAADIDARCSQADRLAPLLEATAEHYLAFYRDYGRHLGTFALLSSPGVPAPLVRKLKAQVTGVFVQMSATMRTLAAREGRQLVDDARMLPFLWMAIGGLAESLSGPKRRAQPFGWKPMLRFAVETLLRGITVEGGS
ncbi:MAG: TetR/AcrR family transcriptional regulator [Polyangia bacterium]